jgi:dienelactone hydrolase
MKKWILVSVGLFLLVVLGPVLLTQFQTHEGRTMEGVHLSELEYTEVFYRNEAANLNLAGMLFTPDEPGPFPGVVMIHGAGTSERDNIWYLTLTAYLQEHGVAVLLQDKRGSGQSEGDWHTSSYEDLAGDAVAAVEFLRDQDLVRISSLGVVGMSQGGQYAPLVAHLASEVDFLVDVVGTSLSSYDVLHYEETNNLREMGFLPGVSDAIAYGSTYFLRKVTQRGFWDAVGNFDALTYWRALEIPAFVLYGGDDSNVPAEASKARLEALGKDNIRVVIYPGSEHAIQDPPGEGNRIFRETAMEDIVEFIQSAVPAGVKPGRADFSFQGDDPRLPIVTHEPSPAISNLYINPGAVTFHDGRYHMFFNSFTAWPGVVEVGYMTSLDGAAWEMVQDEPIFTTDQVPYGKGYADISSVVVLADGSWVMYFHTVGEGQIGLATAASPLGPWRVDPEPVLLPGPEGAWDADGLGWPSVVRDGVGFRMYYGAEESGHYAIGMATSPDGLQWTKYDDPETIAAPFIESDPVLIPSDDWERIKVDRPRAAVSPDGWVMLYQGGLAVEQRGLAVSADGIHWTRHPANPIFRSESFPIEGARTWDTALLYHQNRYLCWMEIGTLAGTDLYLAVHEGSLLE